MSDIIPFPRAKQKLIKEIKTAYYDHLYEDASDLFEEYERFFEMDDFLAELKCDILYQLERYLELREEAIILLKQGLGSYDALMIYYVQALNGLGQYFEVVKVIDQVIDEVSNHQSRMRLFPLKEYAESQLEAYNQQAAQQLESFDQLALHEQVQTILTLIDYSQFNYKSSVANLIETLELAPNLISIMLEYLRLAHYEERLTVAKYGHEKTVIPGDLPGIEHSEMKQQLIPQVLEFVEEEAAQLVREAYRLLTNHAIMLYPLDIYRLGSQDDWITAYQNYFKSMLGMSELDEQNDLIQLIIAIDREP